MRLFINVVCSKDEPEKSKKMCFFLDYLKVNYGVSQLEAYPKGDGPPSIRIFVERSFFPYEHFLEHSRDIENIIEETKEAYQVAKLCLDGKI